jgi:spermidine synthase
MYLSQPIQHFVDLAILLILSGLTTTFLLRFYREQPSGRTGRTRGSWLGRWTFSADTLGGFSYRQLVLVSIAALFLELLMIRWISSEIRIFAYFKNFVLIACFLGLGLGCSMCRRRLNLLGMLVPLTVLVVLVNLSGSRMHSLIQTLPTYLGSASEVQIWGVPMLPWSWGSLLNLSIAVAAIVPIFSFISLLFVPLGQLIGWYLETAPKGVLGYTVNVLGSLVGIVLYTLLCFLDQPPAVWFLVAGFVVFLLFWRSPWLKWSAAALFACYALTAVVATPSGTKVYWSPYQKLSISSVKTDGQVIGYELQTNGSWYQRIIDLSPQFVAAHPEMFAPPASPVGWNAYNLPYRFYNQPSSVLILGAGMGNDVAAAVRNDAQRVVAVEIDPLIVNLGRQLHFEKPYESPRVHVVVDDARSYLQNSSDHFDLIVFSLLDSHTTSSHFSNIRIDNYVYTVEALRAAKERLRPDGIFIVKFAVMTPWIGGRLQGLVEAVFGQKPLEVSANYLDATSNERFFVAGSSTRLARALAEPGLAQFLHTHSTFDTEPASLTTDNWPYFYQHEPGLPASVIVVALVLVALCWSFLRQTGTGGHSIRWVFFFLGAGFMLLEAQIVSKVALLFGTTWVVNSIVVSGLLILIVAANTVSEFWRGIPLWSAYAGLFTSLLVDYLVPLEKYFFSSLLLKILAVTAILCLPVFFAGVVFIRVFAAERFSGEALGSNLLGALVGGMLESLSLWSGIRSLLIVAGILYVFSWIALRAQVWVIRPASEPAFRLPESQ